MEAAVINLKAELEKRKTGLNAQKNEKQDGSKFTQFRVKGSKCNPSVNLKTPSESKSEEEINVLEKSRLMLEKKAALYDQMKNGSDVLENEELNEKFLINFQKKIEDNLSQERKDQDKMKQSIRKENLDEDDDKWIEYVDPLGRTRKCLKEDLEYMKQRDREMMPEPPKPDLEQLKREKIHAKWDKIEDESKDKRDIHYQDILFDEAREHGVGFMPFSRDEAERTAQRDELNQLREESKKAEVTSKAARKEAKRKMADRLAKVRQRKRLKMGLPIKDIFEENMPLVSSSDEETPEEPLAKPASSTSPPKPISVREWDVGKSTSVMDQKQWNESRRKLRDEEFAPPSAY